PGALPARILVGEGDGGPASGPPGAPLDSETRALMEQGLDQDFGDVRVHTDAAAVALTEENAADAVTIGDEIYFRPGRFQPDTPEGSALLAHELAHVAQQRARGPVESSEALEAEA